MGSDIPGTFMSGSLLAAAWAAAASRAASLCAVSAPPLGPLESPSSSAARGFSSCENSGEFC